MRLPILLASSSALLLAGCLSSDGDSWRDLQRTRLARMHQPRTPEQTLHEVLQSAPRPSRGTSPDTGASPQEAQHLDERLPVRQNGPRAMRQAWQPLEATVDVGTGTISAHVSGTRLDDRTRARFVRARLDAGTGAALHVELNDSNGDLFAGVLVNDGIDPARADAELSGIDAFPHLRFDDLVEGLDMPVRFGIFTDWQQLQHGAADLNRTWLSIGPRLVIEPGLPLAAGSDTHLELFGRVGGDVGYAWFTDQYRNGQDRDATVRWSGELGAGLRGTLGRLHGELGYRVVETTFGPLQTDLLGSHGRSGLGRQQFYLGFGITY